MAISLFPRVARAVAVSEAEAEFEITLQVFRLLSALPPPAQKRVLIHVSECLAERAEYRYHDEDAG